MGYGPWDHIGLAMTEHRAHTQRIPGCDILAMTERTGHKQGICVTYEVHSRPWGKAM